MRARTRLVQQAGARLQMRFLLAPAVLLLCSSLPGACRCLQTCQQIGLCMCFPARFRHHQPGSFRPFLPLPQLRRMALHKVKRAMLSPVALPGKAAAPQQGAVASSRGWDLLQKFQARILGPWVRLP